MQSMLRLLQKEHRGTSPSHLVFLRRHTSQAATARFLGYADPDRVKVAAWDGAFGEARNSSDEPDGRRFWKAVLVWFIRSASRLSASDASLFIIE